MLTTHKSIKPSGVKIYRNVRNQCLVLNEKSVFLQSDVKVITNVKVLYAGLRTHCTTEFLPFSFYKYFSVGVDLRKSLSMDICKENVFLAVIIK